MGRQITIVNRTSILFIQLGLGSFYPNFLLSGIIWPIEGMPVILQYLAFMLPQTYACEAMRSVLSRYQRPAVMLFRYSQILTEASFLFSKIVLPYEMV
jgi:ABC-type multidrug transport system permease subunit